MSRLNRLAILVALALASACLGTYAGQNAPAPSTPPVAPGSSTSLAQWAAGALDENPAQSAEAQKHLRLAGQEGLDALLALKLDFAADSDPSSLTPAQARARNAIDHVAMQKDAWASGLFWYTDLSAALAQSQRTHKPILSLRMLGNLNDDLSCANSRFFRSTLYANAQVSQFLREHFILHWQSVRPVPVITIDMGDGRKIVRTITGNSIHYVLDSRGRLIDGFPGVYGSQAFMRVLSDAAQCATRTGDQSDANFVSIRRDYLSTAIRARQASWSQDLARAGFTTTAITPGATYTVTNVVNPNAAQAGMLTVSKAAVEIPMVVAVLPGTQALLAATTDASWKKIAAMHESDGDVQLDRSSRTLIDEKSGLTLAAGGFRGSDEKMLQNLRDSIAMDTVKNEYTLHDQIQQWLAQENAPGDLNAFNDQVYAKVFLTPKSDPWLGLVPADTFTGLDHDGLVNP